MAEGLVGADQLSQLMVAVGRFPGLHRIAPAEIVHSGHVTDVRTRGHFMKNITNLGKRRISGCGKVTDKTVYI